MCLQASPTTSLSHSLLWATWFIECNHTPTSHNWVCQWTKSRISNGVTSLILHHNSVWNEQRRHTSFTTDQISVWNGSYRHTSLIPDPNSVWNGSYRHTSHPSLNQDLLTHDCHPRSHPSMKRDLHVWTHKSLPDHTPIQNKSNGLIPVSLNRSIPILPH